MKQPPNAKQNFSASDKIKILLVSIALAILLLVFGLLMGILLRQSGFRLPMPATQSQAAPNGPPTAIIPVTSNTQTVFVPTADCGSPTLVLGTTTFQIQNLTPTADGSLTMPSDTSGIAYWVKGTNSNYVFVLPPAPENLDVMDTITVESPATVTWSDCNSATYDLSAPQQSSLKSSTLMGQSQEGITVFFQSDSTDAGFVFTGGLMEQQITTIDTPSANEVQAEIGLLETTASSDGKTIKISISINNYGTSSITLSASDVSLTQLDGTSSALKSSQPRLPEGIQPGQTKNFEFTFARPSAPIATLKIFTVEYDIEGY